MGKLEELMQEVMRIIETQGFLPDSVELKVKVGENWYQVKWKKPVVYSACDEFDLFDAEIEAKGKSARVNSVKKSKKKKKAKK